MTDWHAVIGDPNQADAIRDRLLHDAHRIELKGRSIRRTHDAPANRRKERHDDHVRETPDAPAGREQPVDPGGAMENARDTLGGNCAVAESACPTAPWTPQAAPTGTTGNRIDAHWHDSTSRISTRRYDTDGRQLTDERCYAPMGAPFHRNP